MKKKILALCLIIALGATAVIGGALAYFTDKDVKVNTFTVGSVSIDLIESQLHRTNASGNSLLASPAFADRLIAADEYAAAHGWSNTYYPDSLIKSDAETYQEEYLSEAGSNMVPGSNVHKMPYVLNTGKNDAYVRVRVQIPCSLFVILDNGPSMWTTTAMNVGDVTSEAVDAYLAAGDADQFIAQTGDAYKVINQNGVACYEFDFTYTKALAPEEMTFWNCWGNIRIAPTATAGDLQGVESFEVRVEADAIQAEGFENAAAAFTAFDAT